MEAVLRVIAKAIPYVAGHRKLSTTMVLAVWTEIQQGLSHISIAERHDVTALTVWRIATDRSHGDVTGIPDPTQRPPRVCLPVGAGV